MSLLRGESPVLGPDTAINMSDGLATLTNPRKVHFLEVIDLDDIVAASTSKSVFIAPQNVAVNGTYRFAGVSAVFGTASSSGTLQVEKTPSGTAVGGGTNLLTGTVSLAGTTNTVVSGTILGVPATLTLAAGDRLSLVFGGTMTSLANCAVTLYLERV